MGPEIAAAADTVSLIVHEPLVNRPRAALHRAGASQFNVIFHYNGQWRQKTQPPQVEGFEIQTTRSGDVFDSLKPLVRSIW